MRIAFWSTTFQADNLALAHHLARQPGVEVLVALDRPERYQAQLSARLFPFVGTLLDRSAKMALDLVSDWRPDVLVVDNQLPRRALAPKLLVLWHGYGWRVDDLRRMKKELKSLVGNTERANSAFCWQAFGSIDRRYRVEHSGFAPENVCVLGSAYSDLLLPPADKLGVLERAGRQEGLHGLDPSRRTVLFGFTWHHGPPFEHWGDNGAILTRLFEHLAARGVNVLVRMHDKHRHKPAELEQLERVCRPHRHVALVFKDEAPDSLLDLLLSDVLVSNYSSLLNAYYYTGKPTVHVDPRPPGRPSRYRSLKFGLVWERRHTEPDSGFKISPEDTGGLVARSLDELLERLDQSLDNPDCCREASTQFIARHISNADGHTCQRIHRFLQHWIETGSKPPEQGSSSS